MSTTHWSSVNDVRRSGAMSGSATFTIVTSTRSMKVPVQIATNGSHLRTEPPCPASVARNLCTDERWVIRRHVDMAPGRQAIGPSELGGRVRVVPAVVSAIDLLIVAGVAFVAGIIN